MIHTVRIIGWRTLALFALMLAAIGTPLPGLPTVPFVLVAAWAGSRGWPSLDARLVQHPTYGPAITAWRQSRAVPRKAKYIATLMLLASLLALLSSSAPVMLSSAIGLLLLCVALWLWRRPEPSQ